MSHVSKIASKCFKWVRNVPEIDEDFIKNYDVDRDIGYFLKVDIEYPKNLRYLHSDLPFLPERIKLINTASFNTICMLKITKFFT